MKVKIKSFLLYEAFANNLSELSLLLFQISKHLQFLDVMELSILNCLAAHLLLSVLKHFLPKKMKVLGHSKDCNLHCLLCGGCKNAA